MTADLEALRFVDRADVYKGGVLAGGLSRDPSGVSFEYLPEYLAAGGPSVATTLPVGGGPFHTAAGAVPAFFAGLLPEGRRLTSLRRAVKTSVDDELSLLLAVGSDPIGDVQVVPPDAPPTAAEPVVSSRSFTDVRFVDLLAEAGIVDPIALPGVQDKISARMISVPLARRHHRYILKLSPPEYPLLVENEAYFIELARRARIHTVRARIVRDADGRSGLLVERFDRVADSAGSIRALACEDACQLLGRWPADKYNVTLLDIGRVLRHVCAASGVAAHGYLEQVAFAWLTGNGDLHAKNVSVLLEGGQWVVSPAYDLPSTAPYGDKSFALSIDGTGKGLSRRRLLQLGVELGVPEALMGRTLDRLLSATADLEEDVTAGVVPYPDSTLREWAAELRHRRRSMI